MNKLTLIFGGLLFLLVSCGTVQVSSDYDRNADFGKYKTFAFHRQGIDKLKLNDLDKRRMLTAISETLTAKGFSVVRDERNAEIIINLSASSKTKVVVDRGVSPWFSYGPFWSNPYSSNVRKHKEGTIVIDFVDAAKNTLVWQGIGSGLNVSNIENKAERIPTAIQEILEKYPPQK